MTDNKYGNEPLGKSVEEIESESANTINSPVPGEQRRAEEATVIPAVVTGNAGGIPAVINPEALIEKGSGPGDEAAQKNKDNSKQSER